MMLPSPSTQIRSEMNDIISKVTFDIGELSAVDAAVYSHLLSCKSRYEKCKFEECAQLGAILIDITWEMLNTGYWKDVDIRWRRVYSYASLFKALAMVFSDEKTSTVEEILGVCDMGLLMGAPILDNVLAKMSTSLSRLATKGCTESVEDDERTENQRVKRPKRFNVPVLDMDRTIPRVSCPSIESFVKHHFLVHKPVVIQDAMSYWPAMNEHRWSLQYLKQVAGKRMVPIELGSKYTDESWTQKLMTVEDFIGNHIENDGEIGYLAQHQLFDQIPELKKDICIPTYCCVGENEDVDINAWFGPQGTISPLHYDPKHNCLAQVVGSKYIRLYDYNYTKQLYPHEGFLLFNTSQVDVENPDVTLYPEFASVPYQECILNPGEMLYIPVKWWHYVRSLDVSFSVSFWWE